MSDDPEQALNAQRDCSLVDPLVEESHFSVDIGRCNKCGQLMLFIFAELIDWEDGDDSQQSLSVPITKNEVDRLREAGNAVDEQLLHDLNITCRHLANNWPRGGPRTVAWVDGPPQILPHD